MDVGQLLRTEQLGLVHRPLSFALDLLEFAQRDLPAPLQLAGNGSVLGLYGKVVTLRALRVIVRLLDLVRPVQT